MRAEADALKPPKTSNGMYINPLSASKKKAQSSATKRLERLERLERGESVHSAAAESSRVFAESSMLEDGNSGMSGMIANQQGVGLQSEYRLKSFSAILKKSGSAIESVAEEPKIPRVRCRNT